MTLQEAKNIFENYQNSLEKSVKEGYEIVAPISGLQNSKDEIKQAIKIIYVHAINTTEATPDDLEIMNFGYQNLATFVNDTDARLILNVNQKLKAVKEQTPEDFKKMLVREKDLIIKDLEEFIRIQNNSIKEQNELAHEFEELASRYRLTKENKMRILGERLGYNIAMLLDLIINKIKKWRLKSRK